VQHTTKSIVGATAISCKVQGSRYLLTTGIQYSDGTSMTTTFNNDHPVVFNITDYNGLQYEADLYFTSIC
jgi:hypothetical protein